MTRILTPAVPGSPHAAGGAGPTVEAITNRVSCEIARVLLENRAFGDGTTPWNYLIKYNGVAAVHLDLEVDVSNAFNPSLSYIDPITGGMNQMWTLAVSGQFNGMVTRHLTFDYFIDLPKLSKYFGDAQEQAATCETRTGLAGDLRIGEAFVTGLGTLDATGKYNLFGKLGPGPKSNALFAATKRLDSNIAQDPASADTQSALRDQLSALRALDATVTMPTEEFNSRLMEAQSALEHYDNAAAANKSRNQASDQLTLQSRIELNGIKAGQNKVGDQSGGSTSFGTEVDFSIMANVGGGPNLSKTHWKIGSGGSGGGGSGGAGGGGGSGGGGQGGGGSNLLAHNTGSTDSIQITVALSCFDGEGQDRKGEPQNYWETIPRCDENGGRNIRNELTNKNYLERLNSLLEAR